MYGTRGRRSPTPGQRVSSCRGRASSGKRLTSTSRGSRRCERRLGVPETFRVRSSQRATRGVSGLLLQGPRQVWGGASSQSRSPIGSAVTDTVIPTLGRRRWNLGSSLASKSNVDQQGRTNLGDPIVDSNEMGRAAGDEMATLFGVLCFATLWADDADRAVRGSARRRGGIRFSVVHPPPVRRSDAPACVRWAWGCPSPEGLHPGRAELPEV